MERLTVICDKCAHVMHPRRLSSHIMFDCPQCGAMSGRHANDLFRTMYKWIVEFEKFVQKLSSPEDEDKS